MGGRGTFHGIDAGILEQGTPPAAVPPAFPGLLGRSGTLKRGKRAGVVTIMLKSKTFEFITHPPVRQPHARLLNEHWPTSYWRRTYDNWQEIPIPIGRHNPGLRLGWQRSTTDSFRGFNPNLAAMPQAASRCRHGGPASCLRPSKCRASVVRSTLPRPEFRPSRPVERQSMLKMTASEQCFAL